MRQVSRHPLASARGHALNRPRNTVRLTPEPDPSRRAKVTNIRTGIARSCSNFQAVSA